MGTVPAHTSQPGWAGWGMPFGDMVDMVVSPVCAWCMDTKAPGCSPFSGSPAPLSELLPAILPASFLCAATLLRQMQTHPLQ